MGMPTQIGGRRVQGGHHARAHVGSNCLAQLAAREQPRSASQPAFIRLGLALVGIGLIAASSGLFWWEPVEESLTGYAFTRIPGLYLPCWPPIPFLLLFIIAAALALARPFHA